RDERPRRDRRGADVRDGHAHHRRGEQSLGLLERFEVPGRVRVALLGQVPQPQPVRGDERHLRRGEQRGHEEGQRDDPQEDHAACPARAASRTVTTTSTMRVRCTFSTVTITSPAACFSPRCGTRPNRSSTQPPTVSKDAFAMLSPTAALSSSIGSLPDTRKLPGPIIWIRRSSSSNSSRISPTSSSNRSSSVTSPAVPPYSSTT